MNIAMMSPWNVACGVSIHAELIGREWIKQGHKLKVFAPQEEEKLPSAKDEPFVSRCHSRGRDFQGGLKEELWLDPEPLLKSEYEFFVCQNLELLPVRELVKIFSEIRKRAKTILVVHEGNKSCLASDEYQAFDFDAIVCFDERYRREFSQIFPASKIHLISYPAYPIITGDKSKARKKLGLSLEQNIVFSYGMWFQNRLPVLSGLEQLSKSFPLKYLAFINETPLELIREAKAKYGFFEVREEILSLEKLYAYLHASDVHLLWKFSEEPNLLVSSSAYLTLGSGCPIVINDSGYARDLGEEVFKFKDLDDLQKVIVRIFNGQKPDPRAVEKFMAEKSVSKVASSFIELFSSLS
jgi:hypothetical protein